MWGIINESENAFSPGFFFFFSEDVSGPCAWLRASSPVVPLGSPVTATCAVSEGCHLLIQGNLSLDWWLEDRLIPDSAVTNRSGLVSQIVIPNFNYTRGFLVCLARGSNSQVIGGVQIRAGCMWDFFFILNSGFFSVSCCNKQITYLVTYQWPLTDVTELYSFN